ncbi:MAG: hypothetical protein ABMA64_10900 [Myxococcota bacterium]
MRPDRWLWTALLAVVIGLGWARPALAFPWMIHHGYTGCAQCHVDPSGAGTLTDYGRAQGEILLRTHFTDGGDVENPGPIKDFLFGAVPLPEVVHLQADVRGLLIPDPANVQFILMQSDLRGAVQTESFAVSAALGVVSAGAQEAWITSNPSWNLVSREYWASYSPSKAVTVRAGRMNLPFGIRTEDHILDVRGATRTTINDEQQTGVSLFFNNRKWRAELMGIAGNFQVRPDSFRDRGYSLYAAYAADTALELGVSSLFTTAGTDLVTLAPRRRMAEGVFARWAPVEPLALMVEADVLLDGSDAGTDTGLVTTAIVDWEPVQGLHLQGIGEQCDPAFGDGAATSATGTAAVQWFFAPHADVRLDGGYGSVYCTPGVAGAPFGLLQAHFFL